MAVSSPKKKLCWNCEGRVSLQEENCPYCAVYLGPAPNEKGENKDIYAPPYKIVEAENETIPASPYAREDQSAGTEQEDQGDNTSDAKSDLKEFALPLAFFSAGALSLLFGLILWMFSDKGALTLTWKSEFWYYYLIISIPLLFFGWRLSKSN